MALSIVPLLFSLLLSLAPASTTGNDLVVRVVDKEGKPVAGVQVGLCPHWAGHSSTSGIGVSDAAGNARIERGLDVVRSDAQRQYFVRLGAPLDPDVRSEVDREHLDDFHPVLAVPEHGRVILKLPEVVAENCTARLRCVPRSEERSAIWSGSSLPQIKCKEHQAVCEFVGLGLDLEYEVLGDSLPRPLQGSFHGPEKPGELVTFAVPGFEASPRFIARLVGEDSKPIAHVRLQWDLGTHVESSNSGSGGWQGGNAITDGAGRVVIPITEEQARWPNRTLILKDVNDPVGAEPIRGPAVKVSIPNDARTHEIDLGELMLAPFGSPKKFAALDDAALEKHYLELVEAGMRASDEDGDGHVEILSEMIRRGGAELEHFVAGLADGAPHESWRTSGSQPSELVLRTALARMRRKPDPLTVVVDEGSLLDVDFPVIPTLKCQLVNLDSEGRAYPLDTVRNSYCRIVALDSAGHEARQRVTEQTGGWGSIGDLKAGHCMPLYVDLGTVAFPTPGDYRVRVHFAPGEDLDRVPSMQGRVVFSSQEFKVSIGRRTIELKLARMDELRGAVRALDLEKSVPLVGEHWNDWTEYHGSAVDPEEILFRAGRDALPALLEALEDPKLEPLRRAWILGMLWNIAGTYDPAEPGRFGVLAKAHRIWKWPSIEEGTPWTVSDFSFFFPDASKQAELTKLWLAMKANYDLRILP